MIAAIWRKHWMELWKRLVFFTAAELLAGIASSVELTAFHGHGPRQAHALLLAFLLGFLAMFSAIAIVVFPGQLGGTGLNTTRGLHTQTGPDPSLLFTLSLPIRRRVLFLYRSAFGLLAIEAAVAVALGIDCLLLAHSGVPWHMLVPALWVLPALAPFYFLDSFLLMWFSEGTIVVIQALVVALLIVALALLYRVYFHAGKMAGIALGHFAPLLGVLAACLLSTAFAATTVWCLDRRNY